MEIEQLLQVVRDAMDRIGIRYLVTGSMATMVYGEPRFTNDLDVVIELSPNQIEAFCRQFPNPDFYISKTAVVQAVDQAFQFNVIHPASGLKVDFIVLSKSEFDQSRLARRRQLDVLDDGLVWFTAPEDVILKKMIYYREGGSDKHLRDIAGVLRVQGSKIDRKYILHWVKILRVEDIWEQMIMSVEKD